jgi:hypothetical protein
MFGWGIIKGCVAILVEEQYTDGGPTITQSTDCR